MKKNEIINMMRDIDPEFQQKADDRAASAVQTRHQSKTVPIIIGAAAAGCAVFAAAILIPPLKNNTQLTQTADAPESGIEQQVTEQIEEIVPAAEKPISDFSADTIRLMAPAYAPYILDISAEQQQALSDAVLGSDWIPVDMDEPLPDGEAYFVFVYNGGDSYRLCLYGDQTVILEKDGAESRWKLSEDAARAIAEAAHPESTENHLTWCAVDSINAADIWKNTRAGAKECDMTNKQDIFFKMNNTPDYFDRCSGVTEVGIANDIKHYEFQVDLNTGCGYQYEENYYGQNFEFDRTNSAFTCIEATDGENCYMSSTLGLSAPFDKFPGAAHRIDSPTVAFEDLHPTDPEGSSYDYWNSRTQLLDGLALDSIENYRMTVDYLQDFDKWDIVGTEEVNGRICVHLSGSVYLAYSPIRSFDLYVDEATGVTVKALSYDENGNLYYFSDTKELAFDDDAKPVTQLDPEIIASAKELEPVAAPAFEDGMPVTAPGDLTECTPEITPDQTEEINISAE